MTEWLYNGQPVQPDDLEGFKAFVYIVTNEDNGRKYVGKKRLYFTRRKPIKGSTRKRKEVKESDWQEYYGSSSEVAKDIARLGKDSFRREILRFCISHAEASYWELYEQLTREVLFKPGEYYNNYVGARIHRNHVLKKDKNKDDGD